MNEIVAASLYSQDTLFVRLAREIAIDFRDIKTILNNNKTTAKDFEKIRRDPRFLKLLESEILAWNAAGNTHERTKLKAGALIEEWLVEANARIYDVNETLPAKTELVKLLTSIAGMGARAGGGVEGAAGGERFVVNINIGDGQKMQFAKTVGPKVIEGEVVKES